MNRYLVDVSYTMAASVAICANSEDEAINFASELSFNDIGAEYVGSSFEINSADLDEENVEDIPMTIELFRTMKSGMQFLADGDPHIAIYDAYKNIDEMDHPWILYDENDNSYFEEDIPRLSVPA